MGYVISRAHGYVIRILLVDALTWFETSKATFLVLTDKLIAIITQFSYIAELTYFSTNIGK